MKRTGVLTGLMLVIGDSREVEFDGAPRIGQRMTSGRREATGSCSAQARASAARMAAMGVKSEWRREVRARASVKGG